MGEALGLARHHLILLAGDIRYVQGLVDAGCTGEAVAIELISLMRRYVAERECPECERVRQLLGQLEREIRAKNKLLT